MKPQNKSKKALEAKNSPQKTRKLTKSVQEWLNQNKNELYSLQAAHEGKKTSKKSINKHNNHLTPKNQKSSQTNTSANNAKSKKIQKAMKSTQLNNQNPKASTQNQPSKQNSNSSSNKKIVSKKQNSSNIYKKSSSNTEISHPKKSVSNKQFSSLSEQNPSLNMLTPKSPSKGQAKALSNKRKRNEKTDSMDGVRTATNKNFGKGQSGKKSTFLSEKKNTQQNLVAVDSSDEEGGDDKSAFEFMNGFEGNRLSDDEQADSEEDNDDSNIDVYTLNHKLTDDQLLQDESDLENTMLDYEENFDLSQLQLEDPDLYEFIKTNHNDLFDTNMNAAVDNDPLNEGLVVSTDETITTSNEGLNIKGLKAKGVLTHDIYDTLCDLCIEYATRKRFKLFIMCYRSAVYTLGEKLVSENVTEGATQKGKQPKNKNDTKENKKTPKTDVKPPFTIEDDTLHTHIITQTSIHIHKILDQLENQYKSKHPQLDNKKSNNNALPEETQTEEDDKLLSKGLLYESNVLEGLSCDLWKKLCIYIKMYWVDTVHLIHSNLLGIDMTCIILRTVKDMKFLRWILPFEIHDFRLVSVLLSYWSISKTHLSINTDEDKKDSKKNDSNKTHSNNNNNNYNNNKINKNKRGLLSSNTLENRKEAEGSEIEGEKNNNLYVLCHICFRNLTGLLLTSTHTRIIIRKVGIHTLNRERAKLNGMQAYQKLIKLLYKHYSIQTGHTYTWRTYPTYTLMHNSILDLLAADPHAAYRIIFLIIRQLAQLVRNIAVHTSNNNKKSNKKINKIETYKKHLFTFSFISTLKLIVSAISQIQTLHLLVFPLTTLITSTIKLNLTNLVYAPFNLHLFHLLNSLSTTSHKFIPIASLLFHLLDLLSAQFNTAMHTIKKQKTIGGPIKPVDIDITIKLSPPQLLSIQTLESMLSKALFVLCDHVGWCGRHPAFPEVVNPILFNIKGLIKETRIDILRHMLKDIQTHIEKSIPIIHHKRSNLNLNTLNTHIFTHFNEQDIPIALHRKQLIHKTQNIIQQKIHAHTHNPYNNTLQQHKSNKSKQNNLTIKKNKNNKAKVENKKPDEITQKIENFEQISEQEEDIVEEWLSDEE